MYPEYFFTGIFISMFTLYFSVNLIHKQYPPIFRRNLFKYLATFNVFLILKIEIKKFKITHNYKNILNILIKDQGLKYETKWTFNLIFHFFQCKMKMCFPS